MAGDMVWWALLAVYALIVLRWVGGHAELGRAVRNSLLRPATGGGEQGPTPRVSVIIAAHNEADSIGRCLEGVLGQAYPDFRVLVVNDRSTDETGRIVRDIARNHATVHCLDIEELPEGWLGKTHALAVAAPQADGELLVFTDSDVEWQPGMLAAVVELAQRERLDFLSLWPKVVVVGFWERFLLPACGWVLSLWFPAARASSVESTPVFANGQFLLIRKRAYELIGGHAAVRDELAEDVALAQRARAAGLRRHLGLGVDLFRTRMYEDLRQIVRGWTRIYIGALQARWKLAACIVGLIVGSLPPFAVLAVLASVDGRTGLGPLGWAWLTAAAVHLVAMYSLVHRYYKLAFAGRPYVLLFPVALLGVLALLGYCLLLAGGIGSICWGNVRYRVRGSRAVRSQCAAD